MLDFYKRNPLFRRNSSKGLKMDGNKKGAKKMTDEERTELCKKLDKDMEEYLAGMEAKAKNNPSKYEEGWTEDNWEKEMESHPFFTQNDTLLEQAAKGKLLGKIGILKLDV